MLTLCQLLNQLSPVFPETQQHGFQFGDVAMTSSKDGVYGAALYVIIHHDLL